MGYEVQANGDITIDQGDSIEVTINNIPDDQNYQVFAAVQNEDREPVGSEIMVESNRQTSVVIKFTGSFTNNFVVPEGEKFAKYFYGVKLCSIENNTEETLRLGDKKIGDKNVITVYPKVVEGI